MMSPTSIRCWRTVSEPSFGSATKTNGWPLTRTTATNGTVRPGLVRQMMRARTYCEERTPALAGTLPLTSTLCVWSSTRRDTK